MIDKTIQFFKEIAKIPRESGNEKKVADYLCEFAKSRNLEYQKDQWNNVFIKKQTVNQPPIILQAHTDIHPGHTAAAVQPAVPAAGLLHSNISCWLLPD